jgi:outer membrane protein OmpA-like peptidoglycan-associated protein
MTDQREDSSADNSPPQGSSRGVGITIVIVALLFSGIVYFLWTRDKIGDAQKDGDQAVPAATKEATTQEPSSAQKALPDPAAAKKTAEANKEKKKPAPTAEEKKQAEVAAKLADPEVVRSPKKLAEAVASNLTSGNAAPLLEMLKNDDVAPEKAERLRTFIEHGKFELDPKVPVELVGRSEGKTRFSATVSRPAMGDLPAETKEVFFDVKKAEDGTWEIADVRLPAFTALVPNLAETPPASTPPAGADAKKTTASKSTVAAAAGDKKPSAPSATAPAPATETSPGSSQPAEPSFKVVMIEADPAIQADPMVAAFRFFDALTSQDFAAARAQLDPAKVSEEKLVGLFIVTEDGNFRRHGENPLIATSTSKDHAVIIAQLTNGDTSSDFGMQMARDPASNNWRITDLAFSKLISELANATNADDLPYTPVVSNPQGGESLVIYFHYDTPELHARAQRQLQIIASILKSDPAKTIEIDGHADAKGSADYNVGLSDNRAISVKDQLIALEVNPTQIITKGFGEAQPYQPNLNADGSDNPDGRKYNRRAEVYLNF